MVGVSHSDVLGGCNLDPFHVSLRYFVRKFSETLLGASASMLGTD